MLFYEEVKQSKTEGLAPPLIRGEGHPISPLSPLPGGDSGDKLTQLQVRAYKQVKTLRCMNIRCTLHSDL